MSVDALEIVVEGAAKNALGSELMTALADRVAAAGDRPLLLVGAGDSFSAGLNLKEVASLDADGMLAFLRRLERLMRVVFEHPGPTVAAVNGHAIAGGCILAAVCDHRVGTSNAGARIGLNEVALGLRFPPSLLAMLRYRIPRLEAVVLGSLLHPPQQALELGLLDELAEDPVTVAKARLDALAAMPRAAYAAAKQDLRRGIADVDDRRFVDEVLPIWTSPELKERIRAVLEKRR